MSMMFRGKEIFKPLNTGRIDEHVSCVREWIANIFFYTKNETTIMIDAGYNYDRLAEKYLIDDEYLFTGDTLWFGADGGYSFISTLAESNRLSVNSLATLEKNLRHRDRKIKIITGHTGWTDDLEFAFRHRTELCAPFKKRMHDPDAPYDGYEESDDTEEKARTILLKKQIDHTKKVLYNN